MKIRILSIITGWRFYVTVAIASALLPAASEQASIQELPSLPRAIAGHFVGTVDGSIVVAGGSRWATSSQFRKKVFEEKIEILQPGATGWTEVANLPEAIAYGGSASLAHAMLVAGGQNDAGYSQKVWAISRHAADWVTQAWPQLPIPLANFSMARVGRRIYVFGGQEQLDGPASAQLWSLELDAEDQPVSRWRREPSLPGAGRILAAAVGCSDRLYVIGGASLVSTDAGKRTRYYLREVWSFQQDLGWKRMPDLPLASLGAPAQCEADGDLLLLGGDDGHMAGRTLQPGEIHPGFSRTVLRFSASRKEWYQALTLPMGLVTTGSAVWKKGTLVLPGGEDRPGSRSNKVFEFRFDDGQTRSNRHNERF